MMSGQRTLCFGLTVTLAWLALAPAAHAEGGPLQGIDPYITQALADWEVPGLGLAVVKDDAVVLAKGYGVRKLGESTPVNEKTLFAIASCSKAFTATALAMLVDEGRLSWDDPVAKHVRDFQLADPYAGREITVRDLLCHRSGLPRYDLFWYGSARSREDVLKRLRHAKANTSFRSQFGYQNIMFLAAGQVIPAVAGQSWDKFVHKRIFQPLGMTASNTSVKELQGRDNVSTPHLKIEDKVQTIPWRNIDNAGPAGSINSNVAEMAQWIRLQLGQGAYNGKRLLTSKSIRETHTPQSVVRTEGMGPEGQWWAHAHPESRLLNYGLGWVIREYKGRVLVQHSGSIDGMRSLVVLVPEEKLGLVLLTNLGRQMLSEAVAHRILDAYLGAPPADWSAKFLKTQKALEKTAKDAEARTEKERISGTKPSLPLDKYAGTFRDSLYGEITVAKEKDGLAVRYGPSLTGKLEHWHQDTFRVTWNDRTFRKGFVSFGLSRKGEADEVKVSLAGWDEELTGRRAKPTAKEPAIVLKPEELGKFVGVYRREAPPMEVTVELLDGKLKWATFGQRVATLVPIKPARFRVEGASVATYLEFALADGKVKEVVFERGEEPKVKLLPGK